MFNICSHAFFDVKCHGLSLSYLIYVKFLEKRQRNQVHRFYGRTNKMSQQTVYFKSDRGQKVIKKKKIVRDLRDYYLLRLSTHSRQRHAGMYALIVTCHFLLQGRPSMNLWLRNTGKVQDLTNTPVHLINLHKYISRYNR